MTQTMGWRSLFIFTSILGALVVWMSITNIKEEWAHAKEENFDIIGSLLYALAITTLLYGTTNLHTRMGYSLMAVGAAFLIMFCIFEDHIKHPIFDINLLLKNRLFAMSSLAALLNFSAAFGVSFITSLYLQFVKGIAPQTAGLILLMSPLAMVASSPIAGRLSDKANPNIIASFGMALSATALFSLGFFIAPSTPIYAISALLVIFGTGLSIFSTPNTHAAMSAVDKKHYGIAASIINSMRLFGQTISMGTAMLIISLIVGNIKITSSVAPELMTSIKTIFTVFGVLCVLGLFASLARGKNGNTRSK